MLGAPFDAGAPKRRRCLRFSKCRTVHRAGVLRGAGWARRRAAPSGSGRRWALACWAVVLLLVAQAVVEAAEQAAVLLGGQPARGVGLDVVDLAVLGGLVAVAGGCRCGLAAQWLVGSLR